MLTKNRATTAVKSAEIKREWHFIDASDQILGRLAVKVANIIVGKNKPTFSTNTNVGDIVVITNAEKVAVTGKKITDKKYQWYTGFPGGLRTQSFSEKLTKNPTDIFRLAVEGMLPKNKLRKERMANLHIYKGDQHPHTAQIKKSEKIN